MNLTPAICIELTYRCNHACIFCSCPWLRHPSLLGRELDTQTWIQVLRCLAQRGVQEITFTGGEPTLKEGFPEILKAASELPFRSIAVFTNFTTVDEIWLDLFQQCHVHLATSLPGFFSYRKNTGAPGTAANLLEKVAMAHRKGVGTSITYTVTRGNRWELPLAVFMSVFYHAEAIQIHPCIPEGRALEHLDLIPTDKDFEKLMKAVVFFKSVLKIPVYFCGERRCECYNADGTPTGTIPETCMAGKTFMVISPDGRTRKCLHAPECNGNIIDEMQDEIP